MLNLEGWGIGGALGVSFGIVWNETSCFFTQVPDGLCLPCLERGLQSKKFAVLDNKLNTKKRVLKPSIVTVESNLDFLANGSLSERIQRPSHHFPHLD